MTEHDWLAERFEQQRDHLRAVAYRMLGSLPEAEDAVQDAWLRVSRSDASGIENLSGWLTTITARVCLDALRARQPRPAAGARRRGAAGARPRPPARGGRGVPGGRAPGRLRVAAGGARPGG